MTLHFQLHCQVAQKVDGAYADDHMKFVIMAATSDSEEALEANEAYADALLEAGSCTELDAGDAAIDTTMACYELHFDTSLDTSTYDIDVSGIDYITIFTEHDPSEFEADTHYLLTAAGDDVEAAHTLPEDGHEDHDDHDGHDHGEDDDHHSEGTRGSTRLATHHAMPQSTDFVLADLTRPRELGTLPCPALPYHILPYPALTCPTLP